MSHYESVLLLLAPTFRGYASYTDSISSGCVSSNDCIFNLPILKTRQIRNVCSLGLLHARTLSKLMAWYLRMTAPIYVLLFFLGIGFMAFGVYWFGIFSPGDSKLLWGLCLVFPRSLLTSLNGTFSFPLLILALNIILPYSVAVLVYLFFRFALKHYKLLLFQGFVMPNFEKSALLEQFFNALLLMGVSSGLTYLSDWLGWQPDGFVRLVIVLSVFAVLGKLVLRVPRTPVYYAITVFLPVWFSLQLSVSVEAFFSSIIFFFGMYFVVFVVAKHLVMSLMSLRVDRAIFEQT